MNKIISGIEKIIDLALVVMMLILFATVLAQIFCRFFLNSPLQWSEELARYVFVWVAMLGWTLASRHKTHITVTFFSRLFSTKIKCIADIVIELLTMVFSSVLGYYGALLIRWGANSMATTLPITFALVYTIIPIVATILILYSIIHIIELLRGVKS